MKRKGENRVERTKGGERSACNSPKRRGKNQNGNRGEGGKKGKKRPD